MRCRLGAAVFSTVRDADQDVSPLSELAVQVYNPESVSCKSENTVQNEISGKEIQSQTKQCLKYCQSIHQHEHFLLVIKMYVAVTVGNDSEHYTLNQKG
jgi:hypothetical protein